MLDVVNKCFGGVLIFCGVRWTPLCEDGAFKISDIALGDRFLWGVEVSLPVPGLSPSGACSSLLIYVGFFHHVDILNLFVIILRLLTSRSY